MRRLAMFFILLICAQTARAVDFPELNDAQRRLLPLAIAKELRPNSVSERVYPLQLPPATPAVLELFVKEVVARLADGEAVESARLDRVLGMLSEVAAKLDRPAIVQVRPHVDDAMARLFELTHGHRALLDAWTYLGLDTHGLLRFFETLRTEERLTEAAPALIQMLKTGREGEYWSIARTLRAFPRRSLLNYALLAKTGEMTQDELVAFLTSAAKEFSLALADESRDDDDHALNVLEDRRQRLVGEQLEAFSRAHALVNEKVRSAYTRASGQASGTQLVFFKLFDERKLRWDDRASWREAAARMDVTTLRPRRYAMVPTPFKLEEFIGTGKCNDNL